MNNEMPLIDKLGGRKIIATMIMVVLAITVVLIKGDIPPHLETLLEIVFGALIAGNGIEHIAGAVKAKKQTVQEISVSTSDDVAQQEINVNSKISVSLDQISQGIVLIHELLQLIIRRSGIDRMPEPTQNNNQTTLK